MAFDAYLKIEGIQGETSDEKHSDWIEVLSYSWGATQPPSMTPSTAGGGTIGQGNFLELSVVKLLDKASPKIAVACVSGQHVDNVTLELWRAGGAERVKYMEYKLTNCIITNVHQAGGGGGDVTESLAFDYGKIEWTYTQQKRAGGGGGGSVASSYDREAHKHK